MNPNHPHYAGLGGGPNLNLLDNMLMAAGFQVKIMKLTNSFVDLKLITELVAIKFCKQIL